MRNENKAIHPVHVGHAKTPMPSIPRQNNQSAGRLLNEYRLRFCTRSCIQRKFALQKDTCSEINGVRLVLSTMRQRLADIRKLPVIEKYHGINCVQS